MRIHINGKRTLAAAATLLAALIDLPNTARGEVVQCGALLESALDRQMCARAIGAQDWQPVILDSCPASLSSRGDFLWRVYKENTNGQGQGEHFIRTLRDPIELRRMEVRGWSHDDGGLIQIWGPNIGTADGNQKWRFLPDSSGAFALQVVDGGKCLAVNSTRPARERQQLIQETCGSRPNQLWRFRAALTDCNLNEQ